MRWNEERGLVIYKKALYNLKTLLDLGEMDYMMRPELVPYITYILDYVSKRLILIEEEATKKGLINEVFEIASTGADLIVGGECRQLLLELGISDNDQLVEGEEIPYNQDRFVFSWSNVLTALEVRLKLQYQSLLQQEIPNECPCINRNWTKVNEEWTSGVFPDDENLEYAWEHRNENWKSVNDIPGCSRSPRY